MIISKKRLAQISFTISLLVASAGLPAIAQTRAEVRQGLPGRRVSGGTRGGCASTQPVVALMSADNLDVAMSGDSSLQFLLPEFTAAYPVEFKLRDSQGTTVYTEMLSTGAEAKLVNVQVPKKSLRANQNYQWYFSIICNAQDRSQNIVLSGQLQTDGEIAGSRLTPIYRQPLAWK